MKQFHFVFRTLPLVILLTLVLSHQASAATCTPTGFIRDSINLTAAVINPSGTYSAVLDATGCDIGIYYGPTMTGTVSGATVSGANGFGIVNNGANVTITASTVHNIGLTNTFDDQGYAIYFAIGSGATGSITENIIYDYDNTGIVVNGGLAEGSNPTVNITLNSVVGSGPHAGLAQTGIQLGFGALGTVATNTISTNNYNGLDGGQGAAILVFGGPCYIVPPYLSPKIAGVVVDDNILISNNIGVAVFNLDSSCLTEKHASNNQITRNVIRKFGVTSKSGYSVTPPVGYQAGIQDAAQADTISNNDICGGGYKPATPPPAYLYYIDHTHAIAPVLSGNIEQAVCPAGAPEAAPFATSQLSGADEAGAPHGPMHPAVRL